jgi:hypothetical protein
MRSPDLISVALKVNNFTAPVTATVKVPSNAEITLNPYVAGSFDHQAQFSRTVYVKGRAFDGHEFSRLNLQATVKFDGKTVKFTPNKGHLP